MFFFLLIWLGRRHFVLPSCYLDVFNAKRDVIRTLPLRRRCDSCFFFFLRNLFLVDCLQAMRERSEPDPWPTSQAVWIEWLIEAICKIKGQKQRPSAERICHAIRQSHSKGSGPILRDEVIMARLNQAVAEAKILKVCNKGQTSYKEPNHHTRQLSLSKTADLTKVI